MTRSDFVRMGAGAAAVYAGGAGLAAQTSGGGQAGSVPIGLQLYSVRSLMPKDLFGTLYAVRRDGYTVVEAAGYYGCTATDFLYAVDSARLRCVSAHYTLKLLETQLDQWIEYSQRLGLEYMVCSSSGGMHRDPNASGPPTLDDWRWIAGQFNQVGEKIKAAGMTFGVHNHTPEFAVIDGVLVYDELLRLTDPKLVVFEMDCGWVYASGHDPVDYLSKTPERFPLLHIKDMIRLPDGKMHTPVLGKGKVDYGPILRAATGLKYSFVEQEQFDMDVIHELKLDAEYMHNLTA